MLVVRAVFLERGVREMGNFPGKFPSLGNGVCSNHIAGGKMEREREIIENEEEEDLEV